MAVTADPIPPSGTGRLDRPKDIVNEMEVDEQVDSSDSQDLYTSLKTLEKKLEFLQIQVSF